MPSLPPRLANAAIPPFVRQALQRLSTEGQGYLVGGCVRDLLRGVEPHDFDLATDLRPEVVVGLFPKTVPTGMAHGTVTVICPEGHLEVTTFRGEVGYSDGRRPDHVVFHTDVVADLARRDFTINAMAFDPLGSTWVDPFGGHADLLARRIRCVGEPMARFGEDGLRPLRAVRFASTLRFDIDPGTLAAIPLTRDVFHRVAVERVLEELRKLLKGPRPSRGLRLLVESGLASRIAPRLSSLPDADRERTLRRVDLAPRRLRLAALYCELPSDLHPLRPAGHDEEAVQFLSAHLALIPSQASDAELRRQASGIGVERLRDVFDLQRADRGAAGDLAAVRAIAEVRARMAAVLASSPPLRVADLALDGRAVCQILGVSGGPQVGHALRRLLDAVLDDPARNTADELSRTLRAGG